MSDPARMPLPHEQAAAEVVKGYLKRVEQPQRLSSEQIAKLSPAERLDYARLWDQSTMPAWRDPRG
jgi:hypothetical protein